MLDDCMVSVIMVAAFWQVRVVKQQLWLGTRLAILQASHGSICSVQDEQSICVPNTLPSRLVSRRTPLAVVLTSSATGLVGPNGASVISDRLDARFSGVQLVGTFGSLREETIFTFQNQAESVNLTQVCSRHHVEQCCRQHNLRKHTVLEEDHNAALNDTSSTQ